MRKLRAIGGHAHGKLFNVPDGAPCITLCSRDLEKNWSAPIGPMPTTRYTVRRLVWGDGNSSDTIDYLAPEDMSDIAAIRFALENMQC